MSFETANLRFLDIDDLIVLSRMLEGDSGTRVARRLGLTQPAISQRIAKIGRIFDVKLTERMGRKSVLSQEGRKIAEAAEKALCVLLSANETPADSL